jgi:lysophospholipase L1-like esterase
MTDEQPKKPFLINETTAVAVGLVASLFLAEVLTRIFVPDPRFVFENQIGLFEADPHVGYRNKPDFLAYAQGFIRVETNSLGYRGPDVQREKPERILRILGLGDSVTWGTGVREELTYLRRIEQKLNESQAEKGGVRYEVINTAAVGYSTHQELGILQRESLAMCPDVVLVGLTPNDSYPTEDPFYNVNEFHQPNKLDVRRRDYQPRSQPISYFYSFLRHQVNILLNSWDAEPAEPKPEPEWSGWPTGSFDAEHWPSVQEHLRTMNRLSKEQGFTLVVMVLPWRYLAGYTINPHPVERRIAEFLQTENIMHIRFQDQAFRGNGAFLDAMHLSEEGHELVAQAILGYLGEHQLALARPGGSLRLCAPGGNSIR